MLSQVIEEKLLFSLNTLKNFENFYNYQNLLKDFIDEYPFPISQIIEKLEDSFKKDVKKVSDFEKSFIVMNCLLYLILEKESKNFLNKEDEEQKLRLISSIKKTIEKI